MRGRAETPLALEPIEHVLFDPDACWCKHLTASHISDGPETLLGDPFNKEYCVDCLMYEDDVFPKGYWNHAFNDLARPGQPLF